MEEKKCKKKNCNKRDKTEKELIMEELLNRYDQMTKDNAYVLNTHIEKLEKKLKDLL